MTTNLFGDDGCGDRDDGPAGRLQAIVPGAVVLRGLARPHALALLAGVDGVIAKAPLRHMRTPSGLPMSVAMTNCGALGWVSDARGYRYEPADPASGQAWPAMPVLFSQLAADAAAQAGFAGFAPDACLVNQYTPGTRLTLHQDKDERDFRAPIVSVSLGLPAVFLFGGPRRVDNAQRIPLTHGDVVVWGGPARLFHHGVMAIKPGHHVLLGERRINLTFRKAR